MQPIASLPTYVLSRIRAVSQNHEERVRPFRSVKLKYQTNSKLVGLPLELLEGITCHLDANSVFALRRTCTQMAERVVLDQWFWFRHLVSGDVLGFFFTFEAVDALQEIRLKAATQHKLPPQLWDWAQLVRQLARYSSFEKGGVFHDAPRGFRNRRRIWRIMEMIEHRKAAV